MAVALGNSGDQRAVAPLIGALDDEEVLVRGHAAWGLAQLGGEQARVALEARLTIEEETEVREEIEWALSQFEFGDHA